MVVLFASFIMMQVFNTFVYLIMFTIAFCHLVGFGGAVFYLCHMLHNSDNSEMSTTAAYFFYYGISLLLTVFVSSLILTNPFMQGLYIIVLVLLSLY